MKAIIWCHNYSIFQLTLKIWKPYRRKKRNEKWIYSSCFSKIEQMWNPPSSQKFAYPPPSFCSPSPKIHSAPSNNFHVIPLQTSFLAVVIDVAIFFFDFALYVHTCHANFDWSILNNYGVLFLALQKDLVVKVIPCPISPVQVMEYFK